MQIRSDALDAQQERGLAPIYTVWGDEALLVQEACDANPCRGPRRRLQRAPGAHRRRPALRLEQPAGLAQALSLFADRHCRDPYPSGKPGKAGSEACSAIAIGVAAAGAAT